MPDGTRDGAVHLPHRLQAPGRWPIVPRCVFGAVAYSLLLNVDHYDKGANQKQTRESAWLVDDLSNGKFLPL